MTTTTYPEMAREALPLLANLLEKRGVDLRVSAGGELQLRDRDKCLSPADRSTVHHYRHALADWLNTASPMANADGSPQQEPRFPTPSPHSEGPRCDRCGAAVFIESAIHGGASVRRDCADCGRTWGFPVWQGKGA